MDQGRQDRVKSGRRRWWLPVLVLLLASAAAAALVASKPKPKPVAVTERAWLVATQEIERRGYKPSLTLYGRVESLWSSQLTAGISADVLEVKVIEGDNVGHDTLLIRLDDRDTRLQLLQRKAELKQAEARITAEIRRHKGNLEALPREQRLARLTRSEETRLADLVKKKVGAQSQWDTARQAAEKQAIALSARQQEVDDHAARLAEVEAARARAAAMRDQAQLELERCEVRAPFNGRVARVLVSPGRRVRAGDALLEIYDTDQMFVRAQVPNRYLSVVRAALARGERLSASGEVDGTSVGAVLRSLAGEVSGGTGGVDGLFRLDADSGDISQGRFVRLTLNLPLQQGLIALPHEAIYGTDRVYIVDAENRMRSVKIERAGEWHSDDGGGMVLVRAPDLNVSARVVTTQLPNAMDGLLVTVVDEG